MKRRPTNEELVAKARDMAKQAVRIRGQDPETRAGDHRLWEIEFVPIFDRLKKEAGL